MAVILAGAGFKPGLTEAVPFHVGLQCLYGGLGYTWPQFVHVANPGVTSVDLNSIYFGSSFSFISKQENKTQGIFFSSTIMEQMRTGFVAGASNNFSTVSR